MVRNRSVLGLALACTLAFAAAACGSDENTSAETTAAAADTTAAPAADTTAAPAAADTTAAPEADTTSAPAVTEAAGAGLEAIGLWDDGPCDASKDELTVGLQTVFASGVLTLQDQAQALEASAVAFNARGGANGHCIKVVTCDDGADPNKAVECVRTLDEAGVAATINDTTSVAGADVSAGYAAAGIPRFAISPGQDDYPDLNSYPFSAGGTGTSLMMPQALLDQGVKKIAVVRVDVPAAAALSGFVGAVFGDNGAEVVADLPVPAGTTDYSQFILAAQAAGAEGMILPIGGQEGIQVLRAGAQLDADLLYSSSLGTFPVSDIESLGDYASRVYLNGAIPPAGADLPIIDQLAADLEVTGIEALQRPNMKESPMRSWVGLYALLQILRADGTEDFSRENVKALIEASGPIPMGELMPDWTPKQDNAGIWPRSGAGPYAFWAYDPPSKAFVKASEANWNVVICGSAVGGPCA